MKLGRVPVLVILTNIGHDQDMTSTKRNEKALTVTQTNPMPERALTRKQVAEISSYSIKTLSNFVHLNEGPPFRKHRGKVIYLESEVQAWLRGLPAGGGRC
jgi:hypothetical protein